MARDIYMMKVESTVLETIQLFENTYVFKYPHFWSFSDPFPSEKAIYLVCNLNRKEYN